MTKKMKYILGVIIAFGICIAVGLIAYSIPQERLDPNTLALRQTLRQAVAQVKKGDKKQILLMLHALESNPDMFVSEKLLPDYIFFLNDSNGEVQYLGAMGLYRSKNSKATKILSEYLKAKDFHKLDEQIEKRVVDPYKSDGELYASFAAISALGLSGDKSYIPLLESLQGVPLLELEGGYPVESALAGLGAVDSLTNIPQSADKKKINRAASTVRKIRDPNRIPTLIVAAQNPKIADSIKNAAVAAIGEIGQNNPPEAAALLINITRDPNYNRSSRINAAIAVGKTKDPSAEKSLLAYAQDPNSDIRQYAFIGLVFCMPEQYIERCFEIIMDIKEDQKFREDLAGALHLYTESKRNLLRDYKKELYNCLNVTDREGHPIDNIRILMWEIINELFGEEPSVTLTTRNPNVTGTIRDIIQLRVMRANPHLLYEEEKEKIEEELLRIISVYDISSNEREQNDN
jgi:HEAT repeat protein